MKRCGDLQVIRAKASSKETKMKYYDELKLLMTTNDILDKPANIYNIDETSIALESNPLKVVCNKGSNPKPFPGKGWNPEFI